MSERGFRFGLLGRRVSYSLSPRIFEWGLKAAELRGTYDILNLEPHEVESFLETDGKSFDGLNVTIPHKSLAATSCDEVGADAGLTNAVNTLLWRRGALVGENTDVIGFDIALGHLLGANGSPGPTLVIGAGGAARAVLLALKRRGFFDVTVAVRDPERRSVDILQANAGARACISTAEAGVRLAEFPLIVQATPVGSVNLPGLPLPGELDFDPQAAVMDLIYAPRQTDFLRHAARHGARTMNGLPMLIAQAAAAFELWTGVPFDLEQAMRELLPELLDS